MVLKWGGRESSMGTILPIMNLFEFLGLKIRVKKGVVNQWKAMNKAEVRGTEADCEEAPVSLWEDGE